MLLEKKERGCPTIVCIVIDSPSPIAIPLCSFQIPFGITFHFDAAATFSGSLFAEGAAEEISDGVVAGSSALASFVAMGSWSGWNAVFSVGGGAVFEVFWGAFVTVEILAATL